MTKYLKLLVLFSLIALALRLFLAQFGTYKIDSIIFQLWGTSLATKGISNFYTNIQSDYLPGYIYVVWFLGKVFYWFLNHGIMINPEILYKLPSIFADLGSAFFIFLIAQKMSSLKKSFLTSLVYLFNPAILANSTFWGQVDSFLTFFLLASFYFLLRQKIWLTAIALGFGLVIKPVSILCLPIFFLYLYKKLSTRSALIFLTITFLVAIATFLPFNSNGNFLALITNRFTFALGQFSFTTLNAFNFWTPISILFFGNFDLISDNKIILSITAHLWGNLIFGIFYILSLFPFFINFHGLSVRGFLVEVYIIFVSHGPWKTVTLLRLHPRTKIQGFGEDVIKTKVKNYAQLLTFMLTLSFIAMFLFLTRMHERHLFYGLTFATLLLPNLPKTGVLMVVLLYLNYLANTYFGFHQADNSLTLSFYIIIFLSLLNIFVFIYLFRTFWKDYF